MALSIQQFQKALSLDRQGHFIKAQESLEEFIASAPSLKNIATTATHPPEIVSYFWVRFALDIRSIPVKISKKGIFPWEPACCWTDTKGESFIQIRPDSEHTLISKNAVLAHEYVHALRGRLFSNKFEEICAYTISADLFPKDFSRWRTWLSPLFSATNEVIFSFFWMIGCWALPWALNTQFSVFFLCGLSFLPVIGFLLRLFFQWNTWNKARAVLSSINEKGALSLLIRLTDEDIEWISQYTEKDFPTALKERASKEWRWSFFKEAFLTVL